MKPLINILKTLLIPLLSLTEPSLVNGLPPDDQIKGIRVCHSFRQGILRVHFSGAVKINDEKQMLNFGVGRETRGPRAASSFLAHMRAHMLRVGFRGADLKFRALFNGFESREGDVVGEREGVLAGEIQSGTAFFESGTDLFLRNIRDYFAQRDPDFSVTFVEDDHPFAALGEVPRPPGPPGAAQPPHRPVPEGDGHMELLPEESQDDLVWWHDEMEPEEGDEDPERKRRRRLLRDKAGCAAPADLRRFFVQDKAYNEKGLKVQLC